MTGTAHTCPRRVRPVRDGEGDTWEAGRELGPQCSFCGSLHPASFLAAVRSGVHVTPTDKSYKVYIGVSKFYFWHLSQDQQTVFIGLHNDGTMQLDYPGYFYVEPYFAKVPEDGQ